MRLIGQKISSKSMNKSHLYKPKDVNAPSKYTKWRWFIVNVVPLMGNDMEKEVRVILC